MPMIFDTLSPAATVGLAAVCAFFAPALARVGRGAERFVFAAMPLAIFAYFLAGAFSSPAGETWRGTISWAPTIGLVWDLWVSPAGLLLALLVSGVGFLVIVYAGGYATDAALRGRLHALLMLFMAAMLGIALSENLVALFVFWEITSITSFLLVGIRHEEEGVRKSALDALLVTAGGGIALLAGILVLGEIGGSYRISELAARRGQIVGHPLYPAAFLCIFAGCATKSAQFPFHFWLPGAMAAPAPVSAYLHSATMVKAGIFLLAILHPVLGGTGWWHFSLLLVGTVTMTWGALAAMVQTDLKRLLAFTTVSALGTLVMLLGIEHALAAKAAVLFLLVHAFYKGALFMVAGILEKSTGTRDIRQLRGLMARMPLLGIAAVFAAFSMSGIPPFLGFIAKELLYEVKLEAPPIGHILLVCGILANAASIVVAIKVGLAPFLPGRGSPTRPSKPVSFALMLGPVVLGAGSLLFGLFPSHFLNTKLGAVVGQIRMEEVEVKLKLWHGLNLVLLLSVLTVAAGIVGYLSRRRLEAAGAFLRDRFGWNGAAFFHAALQGLLRGAAGTTSLIQSGDLRRYLTITFLAAGALVAWAFWKTGFVPLPLAVSNWRPDALLLVLLAAASACLLTRTTNRMTAVLLLGGVGFSLAGLFAVFGAPDLAITQLLVETLTLALFALAVRQLPSAGTAQRSESGIGRAGPWMAAIATGVIFALLTLKALELQVAEPVADEIAARSVPEAYGRNVVNVILVDFRALDTLGEICVLAIAGLGIAAMLRPTAVRAGTPRGDAASPVLAASARYTAPALLAVSAILLLRGHNEPGGGFIGGLVGAMGLILRNLADREKAPRLFAITAGTLLATGLLLAVGSGLPGLLVGDAFLAAWWGPEFALPVVGKVKLGTPLVFDLGVYAVVMGTTLILHRHFERSDAAFVPLPR